jgi:pimeloyl-ACP methyl ester carboxylesterase
MNKTPTTRSITVNGRRLVLDCSGHGEPTVVLETGLGAESEEWSAVQRALAPLTRVCRYDRAGRGASEPVDRTRNGNDLVDDLHALLHQAELPGPYVLAGHSLGGLLVRLFAHRHPHEVAGLVLVDAMHEDQFEVFGPTFPPPTPGDAPALRDVRSFWTSGWRDPRSTQERLDLVATCAQARAIDSLGDVPMHVLVAGTFLHQPVIPQARREGLQQMWDALQQRFLQLSSNATLSEAKTSGHFVQRDAPEVVADAIRQMVERVRRGR